MRADWDSSGFSRLPLRKDARLINEARNSKRERTELGQAPTYKNRAEGRRTMKKVLEELIGLISLIVEKVRTWHMSRRETKRRAKEAEYRERLRRMR